MLALKTPAILRPKIEKAKQNELFPLLSNERQLYQNLSSKSIGYDNTFYLSWQKIHSQDYNRDPRLVFYPVQIVIW